MQVDDERAEKFVKFKREDEREKIKNEVSSRNSSRPAFFFDCLLLLSIENEDEARRGFAYLRCQAEGFLYLPRSPFSSLSFSFD